MLVRAAGRRQRRHTPLQLSQLSDALYLPFLCPAQLRWNERRQQQASQSRLQSSQAATLQSRPQSKLHHVAERQTQSRNLATVAESHSITSQYPPPGISSSTLQQWNSFAATADEEVPFINLKEASRTDEEFGRSKVGIGGRSEDLLENVETNLRVQRFGRAERILQKLVSQTTDASYVSYAHRRYLEARFDALPSDAEAKQRAVESMREWFETEIVDKGVVPDSMMLVIMIQCALEAFEGAKQERAVRRLYDLAVAQGEQQVDQVINAEEYTDEQLWRLAEIEPHFASTEFAQLLESESTANLPLETSRGAQATADSENLPPLPGIFGDIPNIQDTEQKGQGLSALKDALGRASNALDPAVYNDPEAQQVLTPRQRQERIEESASEAAITRWRLEEEHLKKMGIHSELDPSRPLGAVMWQWYSALLPALQEELDECRKLLEKAEDDGSRLFDDRLFYGAHLESIPLPQVAATTILYVMSLVAGGKDRLTEVYTSDMKLTRLSSSLGTSMQAESDMIFRKKNHSKAKANKRNANKAPEDKKATKTEASGPIQLSWPVSVKVKLGAMLISKLIETAKISISRPHPRTKEIMTQLQPAFLHKTVYANGKKQAYLSACPDLVQKMNRDPVGHLIAKRLPMVIEPEPWTGFNKGGYLYYPNPVVRFGTTDRVPKDYARAAIDKGDLDQVFSALNVLGKIPWRINENILRVQVDAWNSGEPIANFAPRNPQKEVIEKPIDETDSNAMRIYKNMQKDQDNLVSGYHSQRCFQNFQLEIARAFRHEKIYFPHNIDFRGRAYPIPPYLNHMGADNARALMKFANGKELGVEGLRWLKIHLANVFGYDKASLQEREDFVMQHLPEIYDSVTNPLDGQKWWQKSEDAWQTLAACFELKSALDSSEPTKFVSTLPVHQDGTCNGLQHYAALGGDAAGARQVNLEPGDRPSDVYTAVAESVKAEVEKDYNAGHPVAKFLHGHIGRKVVKQPVMTNVYGVTYYGARAQVKKQLEELFPDIKRTDAIDHLTLASYVAKKIFKSLGEMFQGAQAIQKWLGECADRISTCVTAEQIEELEREVEENIPFVKKERKTGNGPKRRIQENHDRVNISKQLFRSSVIWTTPLRLPVVQPYRSTKRKLVSTKLATLALQEPGSADPVSKRKQLQGFPPNFIHSLDATHMMLSANKCFERNITFASIHDSFWTHASDINDLSRILRDAFIDMHSEDIVGRLRHEFTARYQGAMYLAAVDLRTAVGKKIVEHQRTRKAVRQGKWSKQPYQIVELLKELERMKLLKSEDPEERKKGEEMVTGGSIFAAEADAEGALAIPTEITEAILGGIPDTAGTAQDIDATASDFVDPVLGDEEGSAADVFDADALEDDAMSGVSDEDFIKKLKAKNEVKKKAHIRKVFVWLPLQFPKVPEKGTFDVRRLKQSTYFFH